MLRTCTEMGIKMIAICPKCKNHGWNKKVEENDICCPNCGTRWGFDKRNVYILTGCSGVGKTTTGMALQRITKDYVILDADMFYNIMPHETDADYMNQVEQVLSLSKNISQSGKSVVWTMAGNIDKLCKTYHHIFFRDIKVLALICTKEELIHRMTQGRKITDEGWIQSSIEYNEFFRTHSAINGTPFETFDISGKTVEEAARRVYEWLDSCEQ